MNTCAIYRRFRTQFLIPQMNDLMVYFVAIIDIRVQKEMASASFVYGCNDERSLHRSNKC